MWWVYMAQRREHMWLHKMHIFLSTVGSKKISAAVFVSHASHGMLFFTQMVWSAIFGLFHCAFVSIGYVSAIVCQFFLYSFVVPRNPKHRATGLCSFICLSLLRLCSIHTHTHIALLCICRTWPGLLDGWEMGQMFYCLYFSVGNAFFLLCCGGNCMHLCHAAWEIVRLFCSGPQIGDVEQRMSRGACRHSVGGTVACEWYQVMRCIFDRPISFNSPPSSSVFFVFAFERGPQCSCTYSLTICSVTL